MLHASTQKLIHKLCALTESGDIAWREGDGGSLLFDTEGYRVEVQAEPPSVRLLRNDGKELESASASDLAATPWPDGDGTFAMRVSEMARQALRAARGADLAISRILSSLSAPPQKTIESLFAAEQAKTPEPPPSPHAVPELPVQPPHAATAVGKLFAVGPAMATSVTDAIESAPVEPEVEQVIDAAEEELPLEEAPAPAATEPLEQPRPPLPEPQFRMPVYAAPTPAPNIAPVTGGFGATRSFAIAPWIRPAPEAVFRPPPPQPPRPAPPVEPPIEPKVTSTGLFISGISAVTRQTVRGEMPPERAAPPPAPSVQTPEPKREPARTGADIYKPWV